MKSLLLLLALVGLCSSSGQSDKSACDFIRPLAQFDIQRGESLHEYSNGTWSIPMKKINSDERTRLYVIPSELFYFNTVGEKKSSGPKDYFFLGNPDICNCMRELRRENPNSKFIKDETKKACTSQDCAYPNVWERFNKWYHPCEESSKIGEMFEFKNLKEEMCLEKITE